MKVHVLKGTKQEIVEGVARLSGDVREAIVFVEDTPGTDDGTAASDVEDLFAEMRPHMVDAQDVDDSRQTIYTRLEGE